MLKNYGPNSERARTLALITKAVTGVLATSALVMGSPIATIVVAAIGAAVNEYINIKNWNKDEQP